MTTTISRASDALIAGESFTIGNLSAKWVGTVYYIWSYETLIAKAWKQDGKMELRWFDPAIYSRTTSRHQNLVWQAIENQ